MTNTKPDFELTNPYVLTIRICMDNFVFAVYNQTNTPAFYCQQYPTNYQHSLAVNIKNILKNNIYVPAYFPTVNIIMSDVQCMIVPNELFEEQKAEKIYWSCHNKKENSIILSHSLQKSNVTLLYAVDKTCHQLLLEYYPQANILPSEYPLIKYLTERSLIGEKNKMYVLMQKNAIEIYAFAPDKFLLKNKFSNLKSSEDFIYFLLYTWKALEFNQEKDELYLIGNSFKYENIVNTLQDFIKQVSIIHPASEFNRADFTKENISFDLQTSFIIL